MAADLNAGQAGGPAAAATGGDARAVPFDGAAVTAGDPTLRWASRADSIDGVQKELSRLWALPQALAAAAGAPERLVAARTSVLNLVVVCRTREDGERAATTISRLTGRHPSRTIILVPVDPDGPAWFRAQVKAYGMAPRPDAAETWAEQIECTAGGDVGRHLAAIVAPLLVHDLPVDLWWPDDPPLSSRLGRELLAMADRLVVDGSRWPGDGTARLHELATVAGRGLRISDFAIMRQARWREAVASVFDLPQFRPYLRSLRRLAVTYATAGGSGAEEWTNILKPIYHVAWMASRLDLAVSRPLARVDRPKAQARPPAPGAGPDPGRGLRAVLSNGRGSDVEVVVRPVVSALSPGTTMRVEILAERRGSELRAEVTAEAESVHVRVWEDGVEALDRIFLATRRTDVDLLAEAIEAGRADPIAAAAIRVGADLAGGAREARGAGPSDRQPMANDLDAGPVLS